MYNTAVIIQGGVGSCRRRVTVVANDTSGKKRSQYGELVRRGGSSSNVVFVARQAQPATPHFSIVKNRYFRKYHTIWYLACNRVNREPINVIRIRFSQIGKRNELEPSSTAPAYYPCQPVCLTVYQPVLKQFPCSNELLSNYILTEMMAPSFLPLY